jgi:hypothetical protein
MLFFLLSSSNELFARLLLYLLSFSLLTSDLVAFLFSIPSCESFFVCWIYLFLPFYLSFIHSFFPSLFLPLPLLSSFLFFSFLFFSILVLLTFLLLLISFIYFYSISFFLSYFILLVRYNFVNDIFQKQVSHSLYCRNAL